MNKELENAILLGDISLVKSLINKGCQLDTKDKFGRTIIYDAIVKGYKEIVVELCLRGININNHDKDGKTPLHFSAIYNNVEIANILIHFGADIDSKDENGNTPLSDAVFYSHGFTEMITLLKENGADSNLKNKYNISPKELAESIANYDISYLFK